MKTIKFKMYEYVQQFTNERTLDVSHQPIFWQEHNCRVYYCVQPVYHADTIYGINCTKVTDKTIETEQLLLSQVEREVYMSSKNPNGMSLVQHCLWKMINYPNDDMTNKGSFDAKLSQAINNIAKRSDFTTEAFVTDRADAFAKLQETEDVTLVKYISPLDDERFTKVTEDEFAKHINMMDVHFVSADETYALLRSDVTSVFNHGHRPLLVAYTKHDLRELKSCINAYLHIDAPTLTN